MCNKFSYINTAVLVVVSWEIGRSGCTTTSDIPIIMLNVVYLSIQPLHANVYKKCPTNYHTAAVFVVVSYWLVDTAAAVLVCRHMGGPSLSPTAAVLFNSILSQPAVLYTHHYMLQQKCKKPSRKCKSHARPCTATPSPHHLFYFYIIFKHSIRNSE